MHSLKLWKFWATKIAQILKENCEKKRLRIKMTNITLKK